MARADLARALRNPGRFVLNPSSLYPGAHPYGGAELGLTSGCEVDFGLRYSDVVYEAFGSVEERHVVGEVATIACFLDQWDDDFLALLGFPKLTTGTGPNNVPGRARLDGGNPTGLVPAGQPLLFAPLDPKGKAVLIRRPLPKLRESTALQLALDNDARFALVFTASRDDSGKPPYSCDHLWQLTL